MIRDKIGFKNARSLIFRETIDELFSNYENPDYIKKTVESWKDQNIKQVYLLSSGSTSDQVDIKKALNDSLQDIELIEIPLSILKNQDFEAFLDKCRVIQHQVKHGSCLFLYSARKSSEVDLFASMFMLTLKSMRSIEPEYAIEYITGDKSAIHDLSIVYDFKKYLRPSYEIPEHEGHFELSHDDSFKLESDDSGETAASNQDNQKSLEEKPTDNTIDPDVSNDHKNIPNQPVAAAAVPAKSSVPTVSKAQSSDEKKQPASSFKKSKFTIKVKLLAIISGIIIISLSAMIFIASGFFSQQTERSIQANNLNLAETIAGRVEKELSNIGYKAHQMSLIISEGIGSPAQRKLSLDLFFQNNKDFLYLGIATRNNNSMNFLHNRFNETSMANLGLTKKDIQNISDSMEKEFTPSLNGAFIVHNVSEGLSTPLLGITLPLSPGTVIVLYMDPSHFLKSFKTRGVKAFMVNNQGDVIAHQDSKLVLVKTNLGKLGIVETMLKSPTTNGLKQYKDKDGIEYLGSFKKISVGGLGIITTVEKEKAFAAVSAILKTNLIITLIIVTVAFIIIYIFAKTMSEPIKDLADATGQIERGDFDINLTPVSGDEIGFLTHSFGHMAEGLAERERAKDALGRFVNKQVAELALSGNINLGGETKEAAVFFSDLRGFTAMSEKMTPEGVVSYLNEYFTGMVSAVLDTHGIVDKFIGDAVMAHWGAFGSHGNNTENAINGGLLMRTAIIEFNKRGEGKRPFAKQGCGINTGPVVSGQIGSEARFEFTVIGDTVNLASRIEALNKPFGTDILISQDSYDLVKGIYKVEPMPAIKVKGKTEPQVIYAVIGRNDDPNCPKDLKEVRDMLGIEFDDSKEIDADAKEEKFEVVG